MSSSERPSFHFAGVAGSGMSALAQLHALGGGRASGSDRAFDRGGAVRIRLALEKLGVEIFPQDGSGVRPGCAAVVASTAVEDTVPDVRAARERGVPVLHRSELLARHVAGSRSVAVSGTSGKSTTTAMIFTILAACGRDPSLLTGGELVSLVERGMLGNAWAGGGDLLVVEADESDGTLVRYEAWLGLLLNLRLDHKEPAALAEIFATFRRRTRGPFVVGEDPELAPFAAGAAVFGFGEGCSVRGRQVACSPAGSTFTVEGVAFSLPVPGRHNVLNALAAIAACRELGVRLPEAAAALAGFRGVGRRFQRVGAAGGVEVVDDFAHNPDKIAASLATARARLDGRADEAAAAPPGRGRILAVFQPHGFGPTRFLRPALVGALAAGLEPRDVLWLPEIFYAGGTAVRDISSRDLAADLLACGRTARFVEARESLPALVAAEARPGDLVLVMGARDPSLTDLCRSVLAALPSPRTA